MMKKPFSLAVAPILLAQLALLAGCATSEFKAPLKLTTAASFSARSARSLMPLSKLSKIQRMTMKSKRRVQASLPARVDLRAACTPIGHQGLTNACSAFASVDGLVEFLAKKQGQPMDYSPRFIWNLARQESHELDQNAGVDYRDAVKLVARVGSVPETAFPFPSYSQQNNPAVFPRFLSEVPSAALLAEAGKHRVFKDVAVLGSAEEMKESVAAGMPVVFGIAVFSGIYEAKNGVIPLPGKGEQPLGGHIMLCVGYDESTQQFLVRNSWGTEWGNSGYGYLPYSYIREEWAHVGMTAKI